MAILGNNQTPNNGTYFFDDVGNTQFWDNGHTMPAGGGVVTDMYVYVGGDGAPATGQYVIWGATAILWQSGSLTIPAGSRSVLGQGWQHVSVPNVYVPAGTVNLGWWTSGNVVWTQEAIGATIFQRSVSGGPTTLAFGGTEGGGGPGAYIVYTPGGIMRVRRGGSWTPAQVFVRRSGVWQPATVYVRRSGVWVPAS